MTYQVNWLVTDSNRELAIFPSVKSHPEVILAAVGGRDPKRTAAYAKKHSIPIVHNSYQGFSILCKPNISIFSLLIENA
jgi:predicted dehydrogenase